jgi:ADP-heptose:LPS heptosyltransferase
MDKDIRVQDFEHRTLWDLEALQTLLKQARLVVGNDTGPLHLAGYLGLPVISLFGPSSPAQWAPLGARVITLSKTCSPCSQTGKILCRDPVCMTEITCSAVQQTVAGILRLDAHVSRS